MDNTQQGCCGLYCNPDGTFTRAFPSDCHDEGGHYRTEYDTRGNFLWTSAPWQIFPSERPLSKKERTAAWRSLSYHNIDVQYLYALQQQKANVYTVEDIEEFLRDYGPAHKEGVHIDDAYIFVVMGAIGASHGGNWAIAEEVMNPGFWPIPPSPRTQEEMVVALNREKDNYQKYVVGN